MNTDYKAAARNWLEKARELPTDSDKCLYYMEDYRQKAGVSYKDIGTTKAEVARLRLEGYKAQARELLGHAREEFEKHDFLRFMEEHRQIAGATYADIGTTEAEVMSLKIAGYKVEAQIFLDYARAMSKNNDTHLSSMDKYRQMAGATYEDIGTSESEVTFLKIGGYKAEAQSYLGLARKNFKDNVEILGLMEKYREKAGATYEDIGTSAEEVASLKRCNA